RLGYIFGITVEGVKNAKGQSLLHNVGYFTLNAINKEVGALELDLYGVSYQEDHSMHMAAETEAVAIEKSEKYLTTMPDSWNGKVDETITIGTVPGLKFDTKLIQVKAGSRVRIVFNNNDDMLHNLLIVQPGTYEKVGEAALNLGLKGPNLG